ncbi:MAG: WbuC family cupin fold metalloprotein [Prevotellaceae bacterium]|nr:WbuC family cupin fold metalloprotein [Candidatus Faecinaster equi]
MKLDKQLFNEIAKHATESPRLRMNYDLRNDGNEQSQRMLNVLLPGTFVPIHRHPATSETVVCLEGACIERYYDNEGNETEKFVLSAGSDLIGLQIPAGQFHSLEVPADWKGKAVIIEFKAGKFEPAKKEDVIEKV